MSHAICGTVNVYKHMCAHTRTRTLGEQMVLILCAPHNVIVISFWAICRGASLHVLDQVQPQLLLVPVVVNSYAYKVRECQARNGAFVLRTGVAGVFIGIRMN